jgi:hypothetical protein
LAFGLPSSVLRLPGLGSFHQLLEVRAHGSRKSAVRFDGQPQKPVLEILGYRYVVVRAFRVRHAE